MFKEISAKEINGNLIEMISNEWMLITAGNEQKCNTMTASWGYAGEIWGQDSITALVRPTRYTMKFIEENDYFTVSFYGEEGKKYHSICGSKSGRDTDKIVLAGLTPDYSEKAPFFKEARLVIVLKKQYVQKMEENCFCDKEPLEKWYDNDLHYIIIGKVEKVLVKE